MLDVIDVVDQEPLMLLSKDLRAAARTLTPREARYVVDSYYQLQEWRIGADAQRRSMAGTEPHEVLDWLSKRVVTLEHSLRGALLEFAKQPVAGRWLLSQKGIGPVIAAGLLAYIDIRQAPTVGHIWRLAGLDPSIEWLGTEKAAALVTDVLGPGRVDVTDAHIATLAARSNRRPERLRAMATDADTGKVTKASLSAALAKRPWNARLKVLCWKAGESFVKVSGRDDAFYGQLYRERKAWEQAHNTTEERSAYAAGALTLKKYGKDTAPYKAYSAGLLPDGQVHARATRWVVKLFLAHLHGVMYEAEFDAKPPKPYVIAHLNHAGMIEIPGWPMA